MMSNQSALLFSMAGSLLSSGILWWWLSAALRELLQQLCDRPGSTDFWSRYTMLMLVIAPLSIAVFFTPDMAYTPTIDALRRILLVILIGQFVAFTLVGRSLFNAVRREWTPPVLHQQHAEGK
jgi:hypothetical protein